MYAITQVLLPLAAIIAFSLAVAVPAKPTTAWGPIDVGKQVNTTSGLVTGHPASDYPLVSEYLGIPFAEPPIDSLRFAPPRPYTGKGPIIASVQPASCIQAPPSPYNDSLPLPARYFIDDKSYSENVSEDCLFLNVWTRFPKAGAAKKPVLLWIYGGGFHAGGVSDSAQQGALWVAEQDVVFVSFNYRLGIFGFPGAGANQNPGLLDQRLAVEWVRDNIAAFGGDESRITLFGHSAGGASVDYYSYAWKDDPIVAAISPMSGTATAFGHRTAATAGEAWEATAQLLQCSDTNTTSSSAVMSCMQSRSVELVYNASVEVEKQIIATLPGLGQTYVVITGLWSPTTDNEIVFANYSDLGKAGQFIQRPILTGSNDNEACLFAEKGQFPVSEDPQLTEVIFTCPINWAAAYRASANLPTWKYRWLAGYPNLELNVCPGQPWHGMELYPLFGSSVDISKMNATLAELANGRYLREVWTTFATDPTGGLTSSLKWPTLNSNEADVINLGLNHTGTFHSVFNATSIEAQCYTLYRNGGPDY